ncbi:MAG: DUF4190 domain-containing protein [Bacteroidetes bacterium]|nr:DUF4190 domain-containing protein [Bacteroidota bacterium]
MKLAQQLIIAGIVSVLMFSSCAIKKRSYMRGYHVEWVKSKHSTNKNGVTKKNSAKPERQKVESTNDNLIISASAENSKEYIISTLPKCSILPPDSCDNIILKNGDIVKGNVTDISDIIKYKRCDNLNGPSYSVKKGEVFMIQYRNGTKDVFNAQSDEELYAELEKLATSPSTPSNNQLNNTTLQQTSTNIQKTHGLAVASMVLGILALVSWYASFLFALLAMIFAGVALSKINTFPKEYKGRGMANAGLICGLIAVILWLLIIMVLLA